MYEYILKMCHISCQIYKSSYKRKHKLLWHIFNMHSYVGHPVYTTTHMCDIMYVFTCVTLLVRWLTRVTICDNICDIVLICTHMCDIAYVKRLILYSYVWHCVCKTTYIFDNCDNICAIVLICTHMCDIAYVKRLIYLTI